MTMANATYVVPAIRATLTEVFTNKTPTDAYRGAGRPEAAYFVERAMDMPGPRAPDGPGRAAAEELHPARPVSPTRPTWGRSTTPATTRRRSDHALHVAGWEELKAERDAARADGRIVGLGLSMYVEICGMGPSSTLPPGGWEHSQVTVERDGRISATTGVSPHGQGNETTLRADARRPVRGAARARDDPPRRYRGGQAGDRHLRQPFAGGRRGGAARRGDEGEGQDGQVRRGPARGARERSRLRERDDLRQGAPARRPNRSRKWPPTRTGRSGCPRA